MRRIRGAAGFLGAVAIALACGVLALAQSPRYGLGRVPTPEEVKAWDIAIGPEGRELPPGRGTAAAGSTIYASQCKRCHGETGKEGPNDILTGGQGTLATPKPLKTIGSFWPYATTLWDYVNRAMPSDRPGSLLPDDVYASVAYLLFINGIIGEQDGIDQKTLPLVRMPNRDGFVPDPRPDLKTEGSRQRGK